MNGTSKPSQAPTAHAFISGLRDNLGRCVTLASLTFRYRIKYMPTASFQTCQAKNLHHIQHQKNTSEHAESEHERACRERAMQATHTEGLKPQGTALSLTPVPPTTITLPRTTLP